MDSHSLAVLAHVVAAFWWVAGYVGTNVCTEIARRAAGDEEGRAALLISGRLDRLLIQRGGPVVGLTGLLALWILGYPLTAPWILLATLIFAGVIAVGIGYWSRVGGRIEAAVAASDWERARTVLNEPRSVLVSRLENLAVLAIVVLMVLRPG